MHPIIGYVASALIGISLGLVGSGGSILTIPVLVYLFHVEPSLATAYSLFIVGTTALVGGIQNSVKHLVDFRATTMFAIPSFITVYLTRRLLIPFIPPQLITLGKWVITKDEAIMVFFSLLMVAAAIRMIRHQRETIPADTLVKQKIGLLLPIGLVVGIITGLVGAGGGFLIIPALVILAGLPMKKAVGTSLLIIAANSLIGFLGDVGSGQPIDYAFVMVIAAIAVGGIFLGSYLSQFVEGQRLKASFGWFVLLMGMYIIWKEIP
ncbi:MAG: sulfite exporter TauE/SafE family protein [Bacteroidota bacterium]